MIEILILGGGESNRLAPWSNRTPKILFPSVLDNQSMLEYHKNNFKKSEFYNESNYEFWVNVNYEKYPIKGFSDCQIIREQGSVGSANTVRELINRLRQDSNDEDIDGILIVYGDCLFDQSLYNALLRLVRLRPDVPFLLGSKIEKGTLFQNDVGYIFTDHDNLQVEYVAEKSESKSIITSGDAYKFEGVFYLPRKRLWNDFCMIVDDLRSLKVKDLMSNVLPIFVRLPEKTLLIPLIDIVTRNYDIGKSFDTYLSVIYQSYLKTLVHNLSFVPIESLKAVVDKLLISENVLVIGNGGSASLASHFALDLSKAARVNATALTDPSYLTAYANDEGYERSYAGQIDLIDTKNALMISLSASGNSENIIECLKTWKSRGGKSIHIGGADCRAQEICDYSLTVPFTDYKMVEDSMSVLCHIVTKFIEYVKQLKNPSEITNE